MATPSLSRAKVGGRGKLPSAASLTSFARAGTSSGSGGIALGEKHKTLPKASSSPGVKLGAGVAAAVPGQTRTIHKRYPDYNPRSQFEVDYWCHARPNAPHFHTVTVLVPFFNEEADELRSTLLDLYEEQRAFAFYGFTMHIVCSFPELVIALSLA